MAERARVALNGRFSPGARVELVAVDGEHVLRTSPADRVVEAKIVPEDGAVVFDKNITDGGRYFIRGQHNGFPLEVRVKGRRAGDESGLTEIRPVSTEPRRFSGGDPVDRPAEDLVAEAEEAERVRKAGPVGSDSAGEEEAAIRAEREDPVIVQSASAEQTSGTKKREAEQREAALKAAEKDSDSNDDAPAPKGSRKKGSVN